MNRVIGRFSLILLLCIANQSFAQTKTTNSWSKSPFEHCVFVVNKGQFAAYGYGDQKFNYWANPNGTHLLINSNSLVYIINKYPKVSIHEKEELEEKGKTDQLHALYKPEQQIQKIEWIGSNIGAEIIAKELQAFTYNYTNEADANSTIKAECYKKILVKNIYPNIDLEYILPEKGGVKYSFIIHPGGNPASIQYRYSNSKSVRLHENNSISINGKAGKFYESELNVYYLKNKTSIPSLFQINKSDNTLSFLLGGYDKSETIIIDPWIQNPGFATNNQCYDVNFDLGGNVYAHGSMAPFKVVRYNSKGQLMWVYNLPVNFGSTAGYNYGDFAVDEMSGSVYVGEGYDQSTVEVVKINRTGNLVGTYGGACTPQFNEMWRMEYNRCVNKIVIGGGGVNNAKNQIATLDTSLATVTPYNPLNATTALHDISLLTFDPSGNFIYGATCKSFMNPTLHDNRLLKLPTTTIVPSTFNVADGYIFQEGQTMSGFGSGGNSSCGFNGMACSISFLYLYNGDVLKQVNKNTGATIQQINTGGGAFATGGLSVDPCENIYAGAGSQIIVYNSTLTQIASYNLPATVFDVKMGTQGRLYACGTGFVTEIKVTNASQSLTVTGTPSNNCSSCNGTATASLACGNASNYTFSWSNGQTTQTATGLCAGTYTVVAYTACTFVDTGIVTITGVQGPSLTLNSTPTNCTTASGTASVNVSGGTPSYSFSWVPGNQTTSTATGLGAGTYTVFVTDGNNCTVSDTISVSSPNGPSATTSVVSSVSCNGGNNGSAIVTASGGAPSYTFSWSNGNTTQTASGLSAGTYTVIVTDQNNCTVQQQITITEPAAINVNLVSTNSKCNPVDGTASVNPTGGTGPYSYSWSNGSTASSISNLGAGSYVVMITDAAGCSISDTAVITIPTSPTTTVSFSNASCNANNGSATATTAGGTAPYSYLWSNGQTTVTASNLGAGNYTVTITDANGCTATATTTITTSNGPTLTASVSAQVTCFGGSDGIAIANSSGGTPGYTYTWQPGNFSGATASNLSAGTYTVTTTDATGCTASQIVTITSPSQIAIATTTTPEYCNQSNGSASATVTGGVTPFTYLWSNGATTNSASGLSAGSYTITATDANGCTQSTTVNVIVGTATQVNAGNNVSIPQGSSTNLSGSNSTTYTWLPANSLSCSICQNPVATPSTTTTYTVTGTDANGCTSVDSVIVTVEIPCFVETLENILPNAFSPNGDGKNDVLCMQTNVCIKSFELKIFDRWGEVIFSTTNYSDCWNGTLKEKNINSGLFIYVLKISLTNGDEITQNGTISLIR